MTCRLVLLTVLLALAVAPAARASGPTLAQATVIADRWIAQAAPGVVNHCSGGRFTVRALPTDDTVQGRADGWVLDPATNAYKWDHAACRVLLQPGMSAEQTCSTLAHELMHYAMGPEHTGALTAASPDHHVATECYDGQGIEEWAGTTVVKKAKKKRTRAQIARSMRYKRQMAKIRARAARR